MRRGHTGSNAIFVARIRVPCAAFETAAPRKDILVVSPGTTQQRNPSRSPRIAGFGPTGGPRRSQQRRIHATADAGAPTHPTDRKVSRAATGLRRSHEPNL